MIVRYERPEDYTAIHRVNASAFEREAEANLVEILRRDAKPIISLVAEENGEIVGHILFSSVTLTDNDDLKIIGLGPMAVLPERQREGIGSALVWRGLEECRKEGYGSVVVLGHRSYYPRFGFKPSVNYGIRSEYDVPEDVFMVIELEPGYLRGASGVIHYHPAFIEV